MKELQTTWEREKFSKLKGKIFSHGPKQIEHVSFYTMLHY